MCSFHFWIIIEILIWNKKKTIYFILELAGMARSVILFLIKKYGLKCPGHGWNINPTRRVHHTDDEEIYEPQRDGNISWCWINVSAINFNGKFKWSSHWIEETLCFWNFCSRSIWKQNLTYLEHERSIRQSLLWHKFT